MEYCAVLPCVLPTAAYWEYIRALQAQGFFHIIAVELPPADSQSDTPDPQVPRPNLDGYHALFANENTGTGDAVKSALDWYTKNLTKIGCKGVVIDARANCSPPIASELARSAALFPNALVALCRATGGRFQGLVLQILCGVKVPRADWHTLALSNALLQEAATVPGRNADYLVNLVVQLARAGTPVEPGAHPASKSERVGPFARSRRFDTLAYAMALLHSLAGFIVNAALSGTVNVIIYSLLVKIALISLPTGMRLFLSELGARLSSSSINFALNRRLLFTGHGKIAATAAKYYTLLAVQLSLSFLGVWGLHTLGLDEVAAKIIVDAILGFFSYQTQMRWVFRERETLEINPPREARLP